MLNKNSEDSEKQWGEKEKKVEHHVKNEKNKGGGGIKGTIPRETSPREMQGKSGSMKPKLKKKTNDKKTENNQ